jgi:hypothetical protein
MGWGLARKSNLQIKANLLKDFSARALRKANYPQGKANFGRAMRQ